MPISYLSVIIPSYNEEENFKRGVLNQISNYIKGKNFKSEVILIDDGSTDNSFNLISKFVKKNLKFKLFKINHGGKLKAISEGINKARGDTILISDFDQSTPISEFDKFIPYFNKGADLVIGSRIKKGAKRSNDPLFRYFRSRVLNIFVQLVLIKGIDDTQCGFKAFKLTAARVVFKNLKVTQLANPKGGFMGPWDIEVLYLAKKLNYKIESVPIIWHYNSSKRLSVISESIRFIIDIFTIRYFDIIGKYS